MPLNYEEQCKTYLVENKTPKSIMSLPIWLCDIREEIAPKLEILGKDPFLRNDRIRTMIRDSYCFIKKQYRSNVKEEIAYSTTQQHHLNRQIEINDDDEEPSPLSKNDENISPPP